SAAGTITKANLNINEVSVSNKVYDGTRTASLNGGAVKALNQDDVILINENATGLFESKDAGESRVVLASGYTIKGIDSNNYNLVQPIGLFADISPKPLLPLRVPPFISTNALDRLLRSVHKVAPLLKLMPAQV
ncbi:MAG: filamentous hemagglutinin outer membrane protein, partial [Pseudomonadota bacterium]